MKINEMDHGIAHVLVDEKGRRELWVNKDLKKYPKLYKKILKHELKHMESDKKIDFTHDLKNSFAPETNNLDMIRFMIKHPKSFSEILPIQIEKGFVVINWFLIFFYFVFLVVLSIILKFVI